MATLSVKPGLRSSVPDWNANNKLMSDSAEEKRSVSHALRQDGKALCNETAIKTAWDENDNCWRLSDRIWDTSRWKDALESCAKAVDQEMEALTLWKAEAERSLAATALPLEIATECLNLRDGRRGSELVSDPVEAELKREVEVIRRSQQALQDQINKAFKQLCVLQEIRHQLTHDLQNKMETINVDSHCLALTVTSPEISLKPNPTRVPLGASTPTQWEQFSLFNVSRAMEEMDVSRRLRDDINVTRAQVQNDLEAQREATEFAIRKRTHDLEQAKNEVEWQLKKTQDEIADLERDIRNVEQALQDKMAPLKLAHTRLENRTTRPGMDLCLDEAHFGLVDEVKQLEATMLALKQKLGQLQHSLQVLELQKARMEEDLVRKKEALALEKRSQEIRQRLTAETHPEVTRGAVVPLTNSSGRHLLELA